VKLAKCAHVHSEHSAGLSGLKYLHALRRLLSFDDAATVKKLSLSLSLPKRTRPPSPRSPSLISQLTVPGSSDDPLWRMLEMAASNWCVCVSVVWVFVSKSLASHERSRTMHRAKYLHTHAPSHQPSG